MCAKGLQEPDHDRREEDYCKRPLQEIARLLPEQLADVFRTRHPVVWQLHDERDCLAAEHRAAQQKRHEDAHQNAAKV